MSVFEVFDFIFRANTKDVEEGSKKAGKASKDLTENLNATEKVSKKVSEEFSKVAKEFSSAVFGAISIGALLEGVKSAAEYATTLSHASEALNISTEALDEWGGAVTEAGGSLTGFIGTVHTLQTALNEIALRGSSSLSPYLVQLGINVRNVHGQIKSASELLPEFADAFTRIGKLRGRALGQEIGLDESTITLLLRGRKAIEDMLARQRELGVVTQKQADIARDFGVEWENTGHALRYVFTLIGSDSLPTLGKFLHVVQNIIIFLRNNSNAAVNSVKAIGAAIAIWFLPQLIALGVAAAPVAILITALIALGTAIGFAVDDLQHYEKGQDSLTGRLVKNYPILGDALAKYGRAFSDFGKVLSFGNKYALTLFTESWRITAKAIVDSIKLIIWSFDELAKGYSKLTSFFHVGKEGYASLNNIEAEHIIKGQAALALASSHPLAAQTSQSLNTLNKSSTRNTSVNTGGITIHTQATDARGIAHSVGGELMEAMRIAVSTHDDGVMA